MKKIVITVYFLCALSATVFSQIKSDKIHVTLKIFGNDSSQLGNSFCWIEAVDNENKYIFEDGYLKHAGIYRIIVMNPGNIDYQSVLWIKRDTIISIYLKEEVTELNNVSIKAIAAREKSGFVYSTMTAKQISAINLGQDFTYLIGNTPSAVTTSDAGTGIGYTGIRIRGSDATRINVTINGIPINDAESHGVYWVNMPDLASSTSNVQIQRGVGSSTVGTGSFGANINIQNTLVSPVPYLQMQQSFGSFNTSKSTLQFGTGRINNLNFSGRLSKITSEGYIDRASSDLQSFQFNLNYLKGSWSLNAVSFGGKEKTYQSWYGTPESRVNSNVEDMNQYADRNYLNVAQRENLLSAGRTYNFYTYDDQTDNYWQNHYQLHLGHTFNQYMSFKSSFFATTGKGYYEEYKEDASFGSYGVKNFISGTDTHTNTNLVRQRWLDNVFFGNFSSLNYKKNKFDLIAGAGYTQYQGIHFGKVIWAELANSFGKDYIYYRSGSEKSEFNAFLKLNYKVLPEISVDAEFQQRRIQYIGRGNDNDMKSIDFHVNYSFLNPKIALIWKLSKRLSFYGSYSIGNREPVRSDFTDNSLNEIPKQENLKDLEMGYLYKGKKMYFQFNYYSMQYKNQLVVTGELNDVGSSLRRNVAKSYRNGLELIGSGELVSKLFVESNLTYSVNRITDFNDIYFNYDDSTYVKETYKLTDIAFSPGLIGFIGLTDKHIHNLDISLNFKYVGKQYLDNTLNNKRKIGNYQTLNLQVQKTVKLKNSTIIVLKGIVNNLCSIKYSNNGYTFKYMASGQLTTENFYYPQSFVNFLIGLDLKFY